MTVDVRVGGEWAQKGLVTHWWFMQWWVIAERKSLAPDVWLLFTTGVCAPWRQTLKPNHEVADSGRPTESNLGMSLTF